MSKSLGNVIDPLDTIAVYGTDALRFTLATGTTPGQVCVSECLELLVAVMAVFNFSIFTVRVSTDCLGPVGVKIPINNFYFFTHFLSVY